MGLLTNSDVGSAKANPVAGGLQLGLGALGGMAGPTGNTVRRRVYRVVPCSKYWWDIMNIAFERFIAKACGGTIESTSILGQFVAGNHFLLGASALANARHAASYKSKASARCLLAGKVVALILCDWDARPANWNEVHICPLITTQRGKRRRMAGWMCHQLQTDLTVVPEGSIIYWRVSRADQCSRYWQGIMTLC